MAQQTKINRLIELGVAQVNINARDMGLSIAALAQEQARARMVAGSITDLTDNSGGTATSGNTLVAVVTPTKGSHDGVTTFAPKAGFDTAIGKIEDAHQELVAKVNETIAVIGGAAALTVGATGGAAADDTIAALDLTLTAVATNCVDAATGIQQITVARNTQAAIASAVNWCMIACGLDPITDGSGGLVMKTTEYEVDAQAATGDAVAADGTDNTLTDASVDAALTALGNNIASLAAALAVINAVDGSEGPYVVATHNPATRFLSV